MFEKIIDLLPEQEEPKPNKFTMVMGNLIKAAREEAGMSQEELAKKIYRRRATLSDMENGKAEVEASTLWLLSAYLKKPLSYFYPNYAKEVITNEELGPLEHELLLHFQEIHGIEIQKLAIKFVKVFGDYDPKDLVLEMAPYILDDLENDEEMEKVLEKLKLRKKQ